MTAYLVVAGIVVFVALTRTEIGREGLRNEVVRQFNQSVQGSIEIGNLSGNVLNRLSASDVVVRDTLGRPVITIDSVVLHPSWSAALQRTFSTGRVTLVRPEVLMSRDESGRWNIQSTLQTRTPTLPDDPWSFRSTRIDVIDGRVITESTGPTPESILDGHVFDWMNAEFSDVDGRVLVDWEREMKLVDVLEMDGRLGAVDINVDSLRGQVVVNNGTLALNEVHLRTSGSAIRLHGSVSTLRALQDDPGTAEVDIDLAQSTIDGRELARILPSLPLRDVVAAEARIRGPIQSLVVEELTAQRGSSRLTLEGTFQGLPDSLVYDAALGRGSLRWQDLRAVWPAAPVPSFAHLGTVGFSGSSQGRLSFAGQTMGRLTGRHEIRLESAAGAIEAAADLTIGGRDSFRVDGTARLADVDAGSIFERLGVASRLNGRLDLVAEGQNVRDAVGIAEIVLGPSTWARRSVDSLTVQATGSIAQLEGAVLASADEADVSAQFAADLSTNVPVYRLEGRTTNLDVGPILLIDSLSSAIDLVFTVDGRGVGWTEFEGDVAYEFAPSTLTFGPTHRQIPAHASNLVVRQKGSTSSRIAIQGDVIDAEVTGDVDLDALAVLGDYWIQEFVRSAAEEIDKPYRAASTAELLIDDEEIVPIAPNVAAQAITFEVRTHRSDILAAFLPMLPRTFTDLEGMGRLRMAPNEIAFHMELAADSLLAGAVASRDVVMALTGRAQADPSPSRSMEADFSAAASSIHVGDQVVSAPSLSVVYYDHGFDLTAGADASGGASPLLFRARMDLLEDRNRLVVQDFRAAAAEHVWTAPDRNIVDFFDEAVHVRSMRIERSTGASTTNAEYLEIAGTLSANPGDTLLVRAEDIRMEHVGALIGVGDALGGRLHGRLAYTGLNRRPEVTGRIEVAPLTYRNRHLGRLDITSRYIPGSPDIALQARVSPGAPEDPRLLVEDSDLELSGTFRLPVPETPTRASDAGSLDLSIDVTRADAFFFDYIFRDLVADVTGHITGTGHIGGDFGRPIFNANAVIREGRFHIPEFGLAYDVDGPVTVDEEGIHLNDLILADGDDGEAVVRGSVLFNEYRYFSFNLHAALHETVIMNVQQSRELPFYGRVMASGDVSLTGPLSNAVLQSTNARTSPESDLYIPISESGSTTDAGFIVFADSMGRVPDFERLTRRSNLLSKRPAGERPFLDGLGMDLNILAPEGSTVHLVIDPLLGDVINAVGSGRVQLVRTEGDFSTFGTFAVSSGDYLFTAGEVFFRRFLIDSGTITWDGDPLNAMLDISASFRTRASTEGLGLGEQEQQLIPLVIELDVTGRVATPIVGLALSIDRDDRTLIGGNQSLETILNQPEQAAQYATSVLLTNSFLLTASADQPFSQTRSQLAFNSLSQLVASQLNRYLNYALPNVDLSLGVQGESAEDLDVTYGVALRLLDERLIIRGQGIYQNDQIRRQQQGVLDEFVVEVRLNPRVSVEMFYRREGDILSTESLNTSTTGAGLSYQTEFPTWHRLIHRLFGWIYTGEDEGEEPDDSVAAGTID